MSKEKGGFNSLDSGTIAAAKISAGGGTPPTGASGAYRVSRSGFTARLSLSAAFTGAGTGNTSLVFDISGIVNSIPVIIAPGAKVPGLATVNDTAEVANVLLDKTAKTITVTFASTPLASAEAVIVYECE